MTQRQRATYILSTSVDFLAEKHGVTPQVIVERLAAKDPKICDQWAELVVAAIMAGA